jgi:hypothetical protein
MNLFSASQRGGCIVTFLTCVRSSITEGDLSQGMKFDSLSCGKEEFVKICAVFDTPCSLDTHLADT